MFISALPAMLLQVTVPQTSMWPLAVLGICLGAVILMITRMRLHAFFALFLAAILAGLLATQLPGEAASVASGQSRWVYAVELAATEFGRAAGKITLVIALAAAISSCLMESGAADKVVRRFLAMFGEKRAGDAITASSYILSIPIFFDTFFMLLLPLARALRIRLGKDYLLFVMAICCAGTVTHSMLAPHPGPLAMAETLDLNLGLTILAGLILGIIPVLSSWTVVKWINRRMEIPLREVAGLPLDELEAITTRKESELPSMFQSLIPVLLPILLISVASIFEAVPSLKIGNGQLNTVIQFLGNRNIALLIGAVFAVSLLMRSRGITLAQVSERIGPSLETAGMVILITSAGGAFGLMLKNAGVGDAIQFLVNGSSLDLIVVSWTLAAIIRIAQGSATVAMLTTAAMLAPIIQAGTLAYHPVYIFCSIGFGAMMLSWMNDSGFWVVGRLSGFTEKETLKTWTVVVCVNSVVGLIVTLIASRILPLRGL